MLSFFVLQRVTPWKSPVPRICRQSISPYLLSVFPASPGPIGALGLANSFLQMSRTSGANRSVARFLILVLIRTALLLTLPTLEALTRRRQRLYGILLLLLLFSYIGSPLWTPGNNVDFVPHRNYNKTVISRT